MAAERVLVLSPPGSTLVRTVPGALALSNAASDQRSPAVIMDWREAASPPQERSQARALKPSLTSYRAIVPSNHFIARALQMEDAATPIVFEGVGDPRDLCLVDSLQRPGRNATGYMHHLPDGNAKMLELLRDGFPRTRTIYFLVDGENVTPVSCSPDDPAWRTDALSKCEPGINLPPAHLRHLLQTEGLLAHARRLGLELRFVVVCGMRDIDRLATLDRDRTDVAFAVPWHGMFVTHARALVGAVGRTHHPAIYGRHRFTQLGGLLSVEPVPNPPDSRATIELLQQVLKGRSPASLPVQMPRGVSVAFNVATARAQNLKPSLTLLRRADSMVAHAPP